jgi:putative transcriptional regulator
MPEPSLGRRDVPNARPTRSRPRRLTALAGVMMLIVVALVAHGVTPGRSTEAADFRGSLVGQLLVATADMPDPRFARTVIYMVRHDATGAQGLVVNRPLGDIPLAVLLDRASLESKDVHGAVRLHSGGPLEPRRVFVLHTGEYPGDLSLPVGDGITLTWDPAILLAIARGAGPRRLLFALGYAGWGPGQLEREMKSGAWVKASADEAILFDSADESKWERAIARRKIDL